MGSQETTIQVNKKVKKQLDVLKLHPRESYNDVIERLIIMKTEDEELSPETIEHIEQSLKEIRAGRYVSFEQVKRKAGFK